MNFKIQNKSPGIKNLDNALEDFNLNYSKNNFSEHHIEYAIKNSFGFGGVNTCLLFKKY